MKCPHCLESFHEQFNDMQMLWTSNQWLADTEAYWNYRCTKCPACGGAVILLRAAYKTSPSVLVRELMVWPKGIARAPLPREVTDPFASDYREACNVLAESAKASAALSRRCLQNILRDKAGVKKADLYNEIEEVINSKTLPSDLAEALHHVRVIGNFAAHPEKSVNTGAIVDVEPGEAEWTLDVLESLFDFYFVRPAKLAQRKAAINKKLTDAGKPPLNS
jgi:hypothetical protein